MNQEVEAPDLSDKYQAHAYWALAFHCDCGAGLDLPLNHRQFSRSYFEQMAIDAKDAGWVVPDLKDKDAVPDMTCFCPSCAEITTPSRNENGA